VSSVIFEADNLRTPSNLPVLDCVPDRLRDLGALSPCSTSCGSCWASTLDIADPLDASSLLVLSLGFSELDATFVPSWAGDTAQRTGVSASGGSSGNLETVAGGEGVGRGDGYALVSFKLVASSSFVSNPRPSLDIFNNLHMRESDSLVVPVALVPASLGSVIGAVSKTASSYLFATASIACVVSQVQFDGSQEPMV
jgi:hypothetical protein